MHSPTRANTICASTSAVTSTTSEAVASGHETPSRVIDRAPRTKPPTGEKGRQVVAELRTMRPQKNTPRATSGRPAMTLHATASTANSSNCQAISRKKPPQPTESTASTTRSKPNQPTSTVPANRPRAASAIDSFFKGVPRYGWRTGCATYGCPVPDGGRRLYTNPASPGYSRPVQTPDAPTLVTGATGFVGSAVARALAGRGHAVRVLARPASDRRNLAGLAAELVEGDLTDPASLARAVAGCRYVVHVAADYRIWVPDPEAMIARQRGRHARADAGGAGGRGGADRLLQQRRRPRADRGRHAGATRPRRSRKRPIVGAYKRRNTAAEQAVLRHGARATGCRR